MNILRLFISLGLLVVTSVLWLFPESAHRLVGFSRIAPPPIALLDEPPSGEDRSSPRFLKERNEVVLIVDETTTLAEFLRLRMLRDESFQRQIVAQLDPTQVGDDMVLEAGTELVLRLTPEATVGR